MEPLAAFQVLVITVAAAMFVEAVKPEQKAKKTFWAMFGVFASLGVATNLIAGAWPAASAVMVWIGSSPTTFLIVLLGWVAYLQKPWRKAPPKNLADMAYITSSEYNSLSEDIRKQHISISGIADRIAKIEGDTSGIISSLDKVYSERIADALASVRVLQAANDSIGAKIGKINKTLGEHAAYRAVDADALKAKFENVYLALEAIYDRHRLAIIEGQLNLNAGALLVEGEKEKFDEFSWAAWEAQEEQWRTNVERWCERASKYVHDARAIVFETPERHYRNGDWPSDELFGNSNRVHAYKTFLIIWRNLGDLRGVVHRRIECAAYERQATQMRAGIEV